MGAAASVLSDVDNVKKANKDGTDFTDMDEALGEIERLRALVAVARRSGGRVVLWPAIARARLTHFRSLSLSQANTGYAEEEVRCLLAPSSGATVLTLPALEARECCLRRWPRRDRQMECDREEKPAAAHGHLEPNTRPAGEKLS